MEYGERIAYVLPNANPTHGGTERDAINSARALVALGKEVVIFTARGPEVEIPGVEVLLVQIPRSSRLSRPFSSRRHAKHLAFQLAVGKALQKHGPWNIVETFSRIHGGAVYRAGGGSCKVYLRDVAPYRNRFSRFVERISPKNLYYQKIEQRLFSNSQKTHLITNSKRTRDSLSATFDRTPESISVCYPGIDTVAFSPLKQEAAAQPRSPIILFVGSGFFRKGLIFCFEAIRDLRQTYPDIQLRIAGKGERFRFSALAKQMDIESQLTFLGPVADTQALYQAADLLLLPSIFEPFGLAPLEAMACGVPVVVSAQCGISEIISQGEEGFIISRPEAIAEALPWMLALLEQPAALNRARNLARKKAERFDLNSYGLQLSAAYDRVRQKDA